MANYYSGSGALKGARADLGFAVGRWFDEYDPTNPDSLYVALQATGALPVAKSGRITLPKKNMVNHAAGFSDRRYKRNPNQETPTSDPSQVETINVDPIAYGQEVVWDDDDPIVMELMLNGGLQMVEEWALRQSLGRMAQGLDFDLIAAVNAASTPFDYADQDASAAQWSTPSSGTPIAHFSAARRVYGGKLNSAMLTNASNEYFRACDELTDRFGGNLGAGTLTDDLVASAYASFGVTNTFVTDDNSGMDDDVALFNLHSSKNPLEGFCTLIRGTMSQPGQDANGVLVQTRDVDYSQHGMYASTKADPTVIVSSGGIRITNVS